MSVPFRPYELTTERRDGYLYALVTAKTLDRAGVLSYLADVINAAVGHQTGRVLLERRIGDTLSETDTLFVVTKLAKMELGIKLAIVCQDLSQFSVFQFAADIARHSGQHYRPFTD